MQSCYARAPDQPPDATAYLVISDATAATPSFTGWMLAAEPAASTMEHPVYERARARLPLSVPGVVRRWTSVGPEWIALGLAAAALITVHLAQAGGLVPCALCYLERWPYRLAALLAALGLAWAPSRRVIGPALVVVFLAAAGLAFLHTGVEAGWWTSRCPNVPPRRCTPDRSATCWPPCPPTRPNPATIPPISFRACASPWRK